MYLLEHCTNLAIGNVKISLFDIACLSYVHSYMWPVVDLRNIWQVWLIPIADERVGVQVKLRNPLRTRAIPECFCGGDSLRRGAISSICTSVGF